MVHGLRAGLCEHRPVLRDVRRDRRHGATGRVPALGQSRSSQAVEPQTGVERRSSPVHTTTAVSSSSAQTACSTSVLVSAATRGWHRISATFTGRCFGSIPAQPVGLPYTVPADNPFVAVAGARPEIWALGLRNPWRFSFDRATGDLAIGDVGEDTAEEIDFVARTDPPGVNFGFDIFEGTQQMLAGAAPPRYVPPVIEHRHNQPRTRCGAIGGYVVRDRRLHGLYGRYVYNDLCSGTLRSAVLGPGSARDDRRVRLRIPSVVSFGEDGRGRLYGIDIVGGVYRLEPRRPPPSRRRNRDAGRGATHG